MSVDVIQGILLDGHSIDLLVLHLAHTLDTVLNCGLYAREKRSVGPCCTWSNDGIVIWKPADILVCDAEMDKRDLPWCRYPEIEIDSITPIFLYRFAFPVDDFKRRLECHLETCSAD